MNIKPLFAIATLVLATGSAFAADVSPVDQAPTRAEVHQTVLDARAAGQLTAGDLAGYPYFDDSARSTVSRASVRNDVIAARKAGKLPAPGDDIGYPYDEEASPTGTFDASGHPRLARIGSWLAHRGTMPAVAKAD